MKAEDPHVLRGDNEGVTFCGRRRCSLEERGPTGGVLSPALIVPLSFPAAAFVFMPKFSSGRSLSRLLLLAVKYEVRLFPST